MVVSSFSANDRNVCSLSWILAENYQLHTADDLFVSRSEFTRSPEVYFITNEQEELVSHCLQPQVQKSNALECGNNTIDNSGSGNSSKGIPRLVAMGKWSRAVSHASDSFKVHVAIRATLSYLQFKIYHFLNMDAPRL